MIKLYLGVAKDIKETTKMQNVNI